jgi:hypothetical protein
VHAGLSLQPTTHTPTELAATLTQRLPGYDISEIDGRVLVEHHRHRLPVIEQDLRRALHRIYGETWRGHVQGLD